MAVDAPTRLALYNGALRRLGSRELASVTEAREPRRVLDGIWGAADAIIRRALEAGDWNFAIRSLEAVASPDIEPPFGLAFAFEKPADIRRLLVLAGDPFFRVPLLDGQFVDEAGFWFADREAVYVRYVSDDDAYGLAAERWTEAFKTFLECDLAAAACERITNSGTKREQLERDRLKALRLARSRDGMGEGVKMPPPGSWSRARGGARR